MSTENTNLPSDQEVEAYVRKVAAEEAAKLTKTEVAPQSQEIFLNIGGREMKFKDQAEASQELTSLYSQAAQSNQQTQQTKLPGQQVTDDTGNTWDAKKQEAWVEKMVKNPIEAQEMLDEHRFGFKNPTEVLKNQMAAVQELATQMTIDRFVAENKDYYVSPENATVMQNMLSELGGGRPVVNKMALEAAYAIADKRGLIKRPEAQNTSTNQRETNPYLAAPPIASRGSNSQITSNFMEDADSMSLEALEKILNRQGR